MMSRVRKMIETAVDEVIEKQYTTDRAQFGFQKGVNILRSVVEVLAELKRGEHSVVVLDMKKAYDRVDRHRLLVKANKTLKITAQSIRVFLQPRTVKTRGRVTDKGVELGLGVPQGGPICSVLFNIFVKNLAEEVRTAASPYCYIFFGSPLKMVADDVLLLEKGLMMLKAELEACKQWAIRNPRMKWQHAK